MLFSISVHFISSLTRLSPFCLSLPTDSLANQTNVATTTASTSGSSRPNWAYLRFKGLVVVLFLLLIMALIGLAIRSYLATTSLYERSGTHSLDDGK